MGGKCRTLRTLAAGVTAGFSVVSPFLKEKNSVPVETLQPNKRARNQPGNYVGFLNKFNRSGQGWAGLCPTWDKRAFCLFLKSRILSS